MNYSKQILTLDLKSIPDSLSILNELGLPLDDICLSEQNSDMLVNTILNLAENLTLTILYNFKRFKQANYYDATLLGNAVFNYNQQKDRTKIVFDEYENMLPLQETMNAGILFQREPPRYGYRGDIYLWKDLFNSFTNNLIPETEEDFINQIHDAILKTTEHSVIDGKSFHLKKFDHGGMFGGAICSEYWLNNLIPVLIGRYRILKKQDANQFK
jgi:hypothetical protein